MADPGPKLMRGLLEVFILERLEAEPNHGYALLKEMEDRFGIAPNRNKIYPLLSRFEKDGLIRRFEEGDGGRGKTMYAITEEGREALDEYRRVPRQFRDTISRLWPTPPGAAGAPESAAAANAPAAEETHAAPPAPAPPATVQPPVRVPVQAPPAAASAAAGELPYPCAGAQVSLTKDARSGDIQIRLTGCPMGAYDYCPKCPVYESVAGMRRLLFG